MHISIVGGWCHQIIWRHQQPPAITFFCSKRHRNWPRWHSWPAPACRWGEFGAEISGFDGNIFIGKVRIEWELGIYHIKIHIYIYINMWYTTQLIFAFGIKTWWIYPPVTAILVRNIRLSTIKLGTWGFRRQAWIQMWAFACQIDQSLWTNLGKL